MRWDESFDAKRVDYSALYDLSDSGLSGDLKRWKDGSRGAD